MIHLTTSKKTIQHKIVYESNIKKGGSVRCFIRVGHIPILGL